MDLRQVQFSDNHCDQGAGYLEQQLVPRPQVIDIIQKSAEEDDGAAQHNTVERIICPPQHRQRQYKRNKNGRTADPYNSAMVDRSCVLFGVNAQPEADDLAYRHQHQRDQKRQTEIGKCAQNQVHKEIIPSEKAKIRESLP